MIHLDDQKRKELRQLRKKSRDKKVYVKLSTILMLDAQYTPAQIEECLGVDVSTVYRYVKDYQQLDILDYLRDNHVAYSGKLSEEQELHLTQEVAEYLYLSSKEVAAYILREFGIAYADKGVVKLLHRLGFSYKKTKQVPAKANRSEQEEFVKELNEVLEKEPDTVVYFNDGVHPQYNTRPEYGWILKGKDYEMPSNPGRERVNITGALNARNVTDVLAIESDAVNAQSTIEVWEAAEKRHQGQSILHICDNARYYHSKVVEQWLKDHPRTKVKYLPTYSPNLNLIERLWKFMKKEAINSFYYETKEAFRRAVLDFFKHIAQYKEALATLLTLNFRLITAY